MNEGNLGSLKETVGKKEKRNLEQAYEGTGCLSVLPRYQYGTDLSRE